MYSDNESKSNSVDIEMDETCDYCLCFASGFNTIYPEELRYKITPNEFHESITNINNHFPRSYYCGLNLVALLACIALGSIIAGSLIITIHVKSEKTKEIELFIVASVLILFGLVICCLGCRCCVQQLEKLAPFRQAVEEESKKYEGRHCQWSLVSKKDPPTFWRSRRHQAKKFHLIIDMNPTNVDAPIMAPSDSDLLSYTKLNDRLQEQQYLDGLRATQV